MKTKEKNKETRIFDEIRAIRQKMYELWRDDPLEFERQEKENTKRFREKYMKPKKKKTA